MQLTPKMRTPRYQAAQAAFDKGTITNADRVTLQEYLEAIAQNVTLNDGFQSRDIVQALTINHLILQRHIDELERRGRCTQFLVIALTVASLVGTGFQCWIANKAEARAERESIERSAIIGPTNSDATPAETPSVGTTEKTTAADAGTMR
jgi:hypothetical protein